MTTTNDPKLASDRVWGLALLRGHVHHGHPCRCQTFSNGAAKRTPDGQETPSALAAKVDSEQPGATQ